MECTSSVTDLDAVTKEFSVSIAAEKFCQETETALLKYLRRTQLKGFRPGKAPRQLVEKMHGEEIRFEVAQKLVSSTLQDLISEHKLEIVGAPDINLGKIELGQELKYTAKVYIFPSPKITGYEKFAVTVAKREVSEKDVNDIVDRMRDQKASTRKLESRTNVQEGDVVEGTLSVAVEGEEASRPEPFAIPIGKGTLPAEVEKEIIGMELGQTKNITGALPANYPEANLRGKNGTFIITVNGLSEKVQPELNDEFVSSLGMGVNSVSELLAKIRTQLEDMHQKDSKKDIQAAVLDCLLKDNDFLVPQVLVDEEIRELLVRYGLVDPQKVDVSRLSAEPFREQLGESAIRRVKTAVIVDSIGKQEAIKPTDEDINKALQQIADENGVGIDEVRKYVLSQERVTSFYAELTRGQVLDLLVSRAKVDTSSSPAVEEKPASEAKTKSKAKASRTKKVES